MSNLNEHLFLLVGFGSEYVLGPMAHYLEAAGFDHTVCDFQVTPLPRLPERPLVIITSQHPSTSSSMFRALWGNSSPFSQFVAPDELFSRHPSACKVFIPHDLESPIRDDELSSMGQFDIYCSPVPINPALARLCPSIHTGWIKHNSLEVISDDLRNLVAERGVFFVNHIIKVLESGGADYLMENFPLAFDEHVPIKLPQWPGCDALAESLRARSVFVIDSTTPSTPLIAASRSLYVNAPGSVLSEARYMGTPVIRMDLPDQTRRQAPRPRENRSVPYFDFEQLILAIAQHCGRTFQ